MAPKKGRSKDDSDDSDSDAAKPTSPPAKKVVAAKKKAATSEDDSDSSDAKPAKKAAPAKVAAKKAAASSSDDSSDSDRDAKPAKKAAPAKSAKKIVAKKDDTSDDSDSDAKPAKKAPAKVAKKKAAASSDDDSDTDSDAPKKPSAAKKAAPKVAAKKVAAKKASAASSDDDRSDSDHTTSGSKTKVAAKKAVPKKKAVVTRVAAPSADDSDGDKASAFAALGDDDDDAPANDSDDDRRSSKKSTSAAGGSKKAASSDNNDTTANDTSSTTTAAAAAAVSASSTGGKKGKGKAPKKEMSDDDIFAEFAATNAAAAASSSSTTTTEAPKLSKAQQKRLAKGGRLPAAAVVAPVADIDPEEAAAAAMAAEAAGTSATVSTAAAPAAAATVATPTTAAVVAPVAISDVTASLPTDATAATSSVVSSSDDVDDGEAGSGPAKKSAAQIRRDRLKAKEAKDKESGTDGKKAAAAPKKSAMSGIKAAIEEKKRLEDKAKADEIARIAAEKAEADRKAKAADELAREKQRKKEEKAAKTAAAKAAGTYMTPAAAAKLKASQERLKAMLGAGGVQIGYGAKGANVSQAKKEPKKESTASAAGGGAAASETATGTSDSAASSAAVTGTATSGGDDATKVEQSKKEDKSKVHNNNKGGNKGGKGGPKKAGLNSRQAAAHAEAEKIRQADERKKKEAADGASSDIASSAAGAAATDKPKAIPKGKFDEEDAEDPVAEHRKAQEAERVRLAKIAAAKKKAKAAEGTKNGSTTSGGAAAAGAKKSSKDESDDEDEDDDEEGDDSDDEKETKKVVVAKPGKRSTAPGTGELRSPIVCIMGHVDTGKTKLLDNIRKTNVQDKEAGGITQQIGASFFPLETIRMRTAEMGSEMKKSVLDIKVPGLLIIDTPGHESFTNLRSRGSALCDVAILVVDIMHGLEPQTLESMRILKEAGTKYIVALNKVDRMYGWVPNPNSPFKKSLEKQKDEPKMEFRDRSRETLLAFATQGYNACMYWDMKDWSSDYIALVPTSAITGEGLPDLLSVLVGITQKLMSKALTYSPELEATVLEVKMVEGLGYTIDVILVNGELKEGDQIVLCGWDGPIVTKIRALLTPPPLTELRVKNEYIPHKFVKAAMGVKISAPNLDGCVAGSPLLVCGPRDDLEELKDEVQEEIQSVLARIDRSGKGVWVQASTLGSLEALLTFLATSKIPVMNMAIGPLQKKHLIAASIMLESKPEYAVILAFDVKVSPEIRKLGEEMGVKIFSADIIYHLFDQMTAHMKKIKDDRRAAAADTIVFPCVLEMLEDHIYNKKDPIVVGVRVKEGIIKLGTPLCCPSAKMVELGRVTSIEHNHEEKKEAKKGDEICIKIQQAPGRAPVYYGRHFDFTHPVMSKLTRESIDLLKENFKEDMTDEWWRLIIKLKPTFGL